MFLIKNVYLYDPASGTEQKTDLLIENGKFSRIGKNLSLNSGDNIPSLRVLDGEGLCAAPGLIDTHAHFRDPGYTHKEDLHTGSLAAARGGYTSIILMANTNPVVDSVSVLSDILARAKKEKIHLYSCANVTQGMKGKETVDFDALAAAGAAGFTDDGVPVMDESVLEKPCWRQNAWICPSVSTRRIKH
jgi:dihydroorotase